MEKAINTQRSGASDRLTAPSGAAYLLGRIGDQLVPALFLLVLVIGLSLLSPNFLSISNFLDIARVVSIIGIMAIGMTLVILTRGIDLSVGATFAIAASVTASFVPGNFSDAPTSIGINLPTPLAIAAGLLVGAGIGFVNGFIIAKSRVEPFIVTLATMTFVRGLTYLYTGGFPTIFRPMPPLLRMGRTGLCPRAADADDLLRPGDRGRSSGSRDAPRSAARSTPSAATRRPRGSPASTSGG